MKCEVPVRRLTGAFAIAVLVLIRVGAKLWCDKIKLRLTGVGLRHYTSIIVKENNISKQLEADLTFRVMPFKLVLACGGDTFKDTSCLHTSTISFPHHI